MFHSPLGRVDMDIKKTRSGKEPDLADLAETVAQNVDLAAVPATENLAETSSYFVESIEQARQRADELARETARRSGLAQKELDELSNSAAHVTAFRASGEFRRLKERVCNAERNVVIERDRYARLLSRYTSLSERQTEDVKRIQCMERALSEYQEINEILARQLEQQGRTLERLVMSMRRARDELSQNERSDDEGERDVAASEQYVDWSRQQLQSAVHEASQVLEDFNEVWNDSSELAQKTFPLIRTDSV